MLLMSRDPSHTEKLLVLLIEICGLNSGLGYLYLTGSRFFNTNRASSDWDFFCAENKPHLGCRLKAFGFIPGIDYRYHDQYLKNVWRHPLGVDIQVYPAIAIKAKIQAQDLIKSLDMLRGVYGDVARAKLWGRTIKHFLNEAPERSE